jgi:hypothetical protein
MTEKAAQILRVDRKDGDTTTIAIDYETKLDATRRVLAATSFMRSDDRFLHDGTSPLDPTYEPMVELKALVTGNVLKIGRPGTIGAADDSVKRYNTMSLADKLMLFDNIEIYRGLTVDAKGFTKTFKYLYKWKTEYMPAANMPRVMTEVEQFYTFTEVTHSMERTGVQSGAISLTTPWGGGETNYEHAQSQSSSSSEVNTYLTQRFLSRKVDLDVDKSQCVVNPLFVTAIREAIRGNESNINGYDKLVDVLNEWGWYIPIQYTLGGVLFGTKTTSIKKYTEASSVSTKFGASFKAEFKGIGGGAEYNNAQGHQTTDTNTNEVERVTLLQIGGKAGTQNDFVKWHDSLEEPVNWNTATFAKLYPSIMLLRGATGSPLSDCVALLSRFNTYPAVKDKQKFIDVRAYETQVSTMLNPWG